MSAMNALVSADAYACRAVVGPGATVGAFGPPLWDAGLGAR